MRKNIVLLIFSVIIFALAGCDSIGLNSGTGELVMYLADAPVNDVREVNVTLKEVQVCREVDGEEFWETINDFADQGGEATFDLLTLRFDEVLLGQATLPAGIYNQIRLIVAADEEDSNPTTSGKSYIVYEDDEKTDDIFIPSGQQSGLKITGEFTIEEGSITRLLLDVDVREFLHAAGNSSKIILHPTAIKVINKVVSGNIEGMVFVDMDWDGTVDTDGDGLSDEVMTLNDYDVVIEAYDNTDTLVGSTIATNELVDGREIGSYLIRGLIEGEYTIRAKVMGENDDGNLEEVTTYQLQEEKSVNVMAETVTPVENLILLQLQPTP